MDFVAINPRIEKYFKKTECSDESFFGTVFRGVVSNHEAHGTTFVKWINRGRPGPIGIEELLEARTTDRFLFIRKLTLADYKTLRAHLG
jgi:hypothetical protein